MADEEKKEQVQTLDQELIATARELVAKRLLRVAAVLAHVKANYPHALADTLTFDAEAKKYACRIRCSKCGDEGRWVFTSDLFQITGCTECSNQVKAEKKAARKAQIEAAMELIKSGKVS
jgi:hypothetical protein